MRGLAKFGEGWMRRLAEFQEREHVPQCRVNQWKSSGDTSVICVPVGSEEEVIYEDT